MLLPVAVKFATVGLVAEQNTCDAVPVGADGTALTIQLTVFIVELEHPDADVRYV